MIKNINQNILKVILISFLVIMSFIVLNGVFDYEKVVYEYNAVYLTIGIVLYIFLIKFVYKKIIPKIVDNKIIIYGLMIIFTIGCIFGRTIFYVKAIMGNRCWNMGYGNSI